MVENAIGHWLEDAKANGESKELVSMLWHCYYRRESPSIASMKTELSDLASQNGLTICFEKRPASSGRLEEFAILRRSN